MNKKCQMKILPIQNINKTEMHWKKIEFTKKNNAN